MNITKEQISKMIDKCEMSIREKDIMKMRLNDDSLGEIGKRFGVTRSRIMQVEAKANRKFKIWILNPKRELKELRETVYELRNILEFEERKNTEMKGILENKFDKGTQGTLGRTVHELNLPARLSNALYRAGYEYEYQIKRGKDDLWKVRNLGKKSQELILKLIKWITHTNTVYEEETKRINH